MLEPRLVDRIAAHPFLNGFTRVQLEKLAGYGMEVHFEPGEAIFRQGDPANRFYLIEKGEVELAARDEKDHSVLVQRIGPGDVLGWSWIFPPYRWEFDARAATPTTAIFLYGSLLREICEEDSELGYALMRACAEVVIERLQSARRQLLQKPKASGAARAKSRKGVERRGAPA